MILDSKLKELVRPHQTAVFEGLAVKDVISSLCKTKQEYLVVVDQEGRPAGLVKSLDLLIMAAQGADISVPVGTIADKEVIRVRGEITWREVLEEPLAEALPLLVVDADGRLCGLISKPELGRANQALLDSVRGAFSSALDLVEDPLIITDSKGRLSGINSSAAKLLGLKKEETMGKPIAQLVGNVPLGRALSLTGQTSGTKLTVGDKVFYFERHLIRHQGRVLGRVCRLQEVGREKAGNKEVKGLRDLLKFLEMALEHAYEAILIMDEKEIVRYTNRRHAELFGIPQGHALNKHISRVGDEREFVKVLRTGQPQVMIPLRFKGRDMIVNRVPIKWGNRILGVIGTAWFKDVEEIKGLAERLNLLARRVDQYWSKLEEGRRAKYTLEDLVGQSRAMRKAKELAIRAAKSSSTVLLVGESGTGKEMFAHAIHEASVRGDKPFVKVNCAAIPRELLEEELFGYEPGSFTGARSKTKLGKFDLAHAGTLFLDEICDLPLELQPKLLTAIQEKEFERIGGVRPVKVDIRLIAATNRDPESAVKKGELRPDLYYRLDVIRLTVPPLRDRKEDIPLLANHFLKVIGHDLGREMHILPEALGLLQKHDWPGNVRELANVLERASNSADTNIIGVEELPAFLKALAKEKPAIGPGYLSEKTAAAEKEAVKDAIKMASGNMAEAARLLGVHRTALYKKVKKLALQEQLLRARQRSN